MAIQEQGDYATFPLHTWPGAFEGAAEMWYNRDTHI